MIKQLHVIIYSLLGLMLYSQVSNAQTPPKVLCPAVPSYEFFDTLCFIPSGTLMLPQGKVANLFSGQPITNVYIPSNHQGWALGIAHSWNYTRNVLRMPNYLTMDAWLAIGTVETQLGCIPGATWTPAGNGSATQGGATAIYNQDGCYQIENSGIWTSAAAELRQIYPTRFTNANPSMYMNYTLERASLTMAYEWVMKTVRSRYKYGVDPYAIANGACDPLSMDKVFASFHNAQMWSFRDQQIQYLYTNRATLPANCNWPDFGALGDPLYVTKNGHVLAAIEGRTTHGNWNAGSSQDVYYNPAIKWDTVDAYLTRIQPFYAEYSASAWSALNAKVKAKFISIAGSVTNTIPYQQLGPVIDVIILGLPKEDPTMPTLPNQSIVANWAGVHACWGDIVPVGHIGLPGHQTTICLGNSFVLNGIVDGGESSDISFKWFVNGNAAPFATTRNVTVAPTAAGTYTYTFQTCNTKGCWPATCGITITVNDCGGCGMTVNATTVNTPCQNMKGGKINLTVAGPGSTNYTVNYYGPVSGSITSTTAASTINGLPDGLYNIEVINNTTPTCKAYTNATVAFTTPQNAQLSASVTSYPTNCSANVKATIVENPAPCLWKVNFYEPTYYGWSPAVYAVITPGNGRPGMYQADIQNPLVSWQEVRGQVSFYAYTGDPISIALTVSPTPGASNLRPIYFEIVNSAGTVVWSTTVPANTVSETGPINYNITTYIPTCPFTPSAYTFAWSPTLSSESHTTTQSTGTINIGFTTATMYTVTATTGTCSLTDTVWIQPTCPTALGVDYAWFEAQLINDSYVYLHWATLKEENASHFEIQRSIDGVNFKTIGRIDALGNSNSIKDYQYNDLELLHGTIYYRIAEVDVDGATQYSSIQVIEGLKTLNTSVYPNPSTNNFTVQIDGADNTNVSLVIYDMLGNKLEQTTSSVNNKIIIGENLANGVYLLYIVKPDETSVVYKLIKE